MNTLDLASRKVQLKKVSSTHGGEWHGPCPDCGGQDRFHVWPNENDGAGAYWCRACGKTGDNIQFLRDFEGMGYKEACAYLGIAVSDPSGNYSTSFNNSRRLGGPAGGPAVPAGTPPFQQPEFKPERRLPPADLWQEKAAKFVKWAADNIQKHPDVLSWLAARGIDADTAAAYRLGWNVGEDGKDIYRARKAWGLEEVLRDDGRPKALWIPRGLVIPYIVDGVIYRIRIRRPDEGGPRYYVLPGSSMAVMLVEPARRAFVVVESELDAIACAAATSLAGAVGLGSVAAKPDAAAAEVLSRAIQILNALDFDVAGAKAMAWWSANFPRCDRWPVPMGKDPGEAVQMGTALKQWIEAGLPPVLILETAQASRQSADAAGRETEKAAISGSQRQKTGENSSFSEKTAQEQEKQAENKEKWQKIRVEEDAYVEKMGLSPLILELRDLLRNNPRVKIINTADRYTVLRDGKYVGGRINYLVFREEATRDYLISHPGGEIDARNLIIMDEQAMSEFRHSG